MKNYSNDHPTEPLPGLPASSGSRWRVVFQYQTGFYVAETNHTTTANHVEADNLDYETALALMRELNEVER